MCCATAAGPAFEGAQIELGMPASKGAVDKVWLEGRRIKYSVIGNDRPVGPVSYTHLRFLIRRWL